MQPRPAKSLLCPACGVIVAEARMPRWPRSLLASLVVTTPDGHVVAPIGVGLQMRIARRELAEASSSHERDEAEARLKYLRRNVSELAYDLRCPQGHRIVRTMPQVVRALRRSPGSWVTLP